MGPSPQTKCDAFCDGGDFIPYLCPKHRLYFKCKIKQYRKHCITPVFVCVAFQTEGKLYLILDFLRGGDLFTRLSKEVGLLLSGSFPISWQITCPYFSRTITGYITLMQYRQEWIYLPSLSLSTFTSVTFTLMLQPVSKQRHFKCDELCFAG